MSENELRRAAVIALRTYRRAVVAPCLLIILGLLTVMVPGARILGVFYLVLAPVLSIATLRAARRAADDAMGVYGRPTEVVLDEETLRFRTSLYTVAWTWAGIVEIRATKDFWFFKPTKRTQHIVPRRAFSPADAAAIDAFCDSRRIQRSA